MTRIVSGPLLTGEVTQTGGGGVLAGVTVTVTPAAYSDVQLTAPITTMVANGLGAFTAYAKPGVYTFTCSDPSAAVIEPIEVLSPDLGTTVGGGLPVPSGTATSGQVPVATGTGNASAWGTVAGGGVLTTNVVATSGAAQTIPAPTTAQWSILTLTANCTLTFPTPTQGQTFTLDLKQDGTGSRTVTWPGTVTWMAGPPPTLQTAAAAVDSFVFMSHDGSTWDGYVTSGAGAVGPTGPAGGAGVLNQATVATSGAAQTLPAVATDVASHITLTANCTLTFPTAAAGERILLFLTQDATGSRTVTWPGTVKWSGGTAPTLTTAATKTDCFSFYCMDGTNWLGFIMGLNY